MSANDVGRARRDGTPHAEENDRATDKRRLVLSVDLATTLTGPLTEKERRRITAYLRQLADE